MLYHRRVGSGPSFASFAVCLVAALVLTGAAPADSASAGRLETAAQDASARLLFIENVGQFDAAARFQVWGGEQTVWLGENALWLTRGAGPAGARPVNLRISFPGADPRPLLEPFDRLETHISYFRGSDPAQWRPNVPVWGGARFRNLYPGVDLVLGGAQGLWKLTTSPDAAANVRLRIDGALGALLDGDVLHLETAAGPLALRMPDRSEALRVEIVRPGAESLVFHVRPHTPASGVPEPAQVNEGGDLLYSTFIGGSGYDHALGVAVDPAGAAYVTGFTNATDFPTTPGAVDPSCNGDEDAFVAKLNPSGSALAYASFLGGGGGDEAQAIAVDQAGSAYVTGYTESANFPTTAGVFDASFGGSRDGFVAKLNQDGTGLVYSTFLGGSGGATPWAIAVRDGDAYVTGYALSGDFPTTAGAFDTTLSGESDVFVTRLNGSGRGLVYSTFVGGGGKEEGNAIAVDDAGDAYVTGYTNSADFPATPGAFDMTLNDTDAFVVKLNPAGSALTYATFLGGSSYDTGKAAAVDRVGNVYVTGSTLSNDFPTTAGAFDTVFGGMPGDAFVVKLNAAGSRQGYGAFLGGGGYDGGRGIAVDGSGRAYVVGYTYSSDFPATSDAFDVSFNGGGNDAFVARLDFDATVLGYASYLGGAAEDAGYALALDRLGNAYLSGGTHSTGFPTTPGAFDRSHHGDPADAFVAKFGFAPVYTHSAWLPLMMRMQ